MFSFGWVQGQYVLKHSINAGYSETTFKGSDFANHLELKPFTGSFFGYTITADFDQRYELTTGFYFTEKGYKANYSDNFYADQVFVGEGTIEDKAAKYRYGEDLELTYLEFPFVVKKRITPLAAITAGFNVSVLLNSNIESKYIGYKVLVNDDDVEYLRHYRLGKKSDASFFLGGEIRATEWIGLTFQYEFGLVKLDSYGFTDTRINALKLGLFYVFKRN